MRSCKSLPPESKTELSGTSSWLLFSRTIRETIVKRFTCPVRAHFCYAKSCACGVERFCCRTVFRDPQSESNCHFLETAVPCRLPQRYR
jgi:hypothetical protein